MSSSLSARVRTGCPENPDQRSTLKETVSAYVTVLALFALVGGGHLWGAVVAFVGLCGVPAPEWAGQAETITTQAGILGAGIWLLRLLMTRPCPAGPWPRVWPVAVTGATMLVITVDEAGLLTADGRSTQIVGHLAELVLWTWLAVEAAARRGLTRERLGLGSTRRRPKRSNAAEAWLVGFACASCVVLTALLWGILRLLPGPVLRGDQGAAAGVPELGPHLVHGFWSATVEELLITAVVVGVLAAARRPLWECIAVSVLMRTLPHAYLGLTMLAQIPLGAASAWLYHRYQRVIPLILAHAGYNALATVLPLPLVPALFVTGLLTMAAWTWTQAASGTRPPSGGSGR